MNARQSSCRPARSYHLTHSVPSWARPFVPIRAFSAAQRRRIHSPVTRSCLLGNTCTRSNPHRAGSGFLHSSSFVSAPIDKSRSSGNGRAAERILFILSTRTSSELLWLARIFTLAYQFCHRLTPECFKPLPFLLPPTNSSLFVDYFLKDEPALRKRVIPGAQHSCTTYELSQPRKLIQSATDVLRLPLLFFRPDCVAAL